ncbi:Gamma-glutamylcyclotransferase [Hyella patelloides LEGE 07179]|uniref:glutathione-specific gamma-glutamylcyclotransferase n=1 Tax=Hyella patelloides LEGE 07179 TaxID=945734 RepID=A0A563W2Y4_9CYAN|nr:gamma-glutamylcyclotransferase [Hyella patelloides]VEP18048.1 Gamma-glutamylcyclotransferase [Hyella patelloides LEGE 07179]
MALTREALQSKLLQQLLAHPELGFKILSDEELLASIRNTLQQKSTDELWIFAYGSLIWNPLFEYLERCVVTIEGWQRKFCLLAPIGRGTIENPGLVLGLEKGQYCQGIAYRLPINEHLESELLLLWRREMVVDSYIPTWVKTKRGNKEIETLTFTVNPQHPVYVNNLSKANIVESLATARGAIGSSSEYLSHTVKGLLAEGIEDRKLIELEHLVKAKQKEESQ